MIRFLAVILFSTLVELLSNVGDGRDQAAAA
jgi:hypothetical protein